MFGWRYIGKTDSSRDRKRYGITVEHYSDRWLSIHWSRRTFQFVYYGGRNRLTGPGENGEVMRHFLGGKDRRSRGVGFRDGFAQAAAKPPVKLVKGGDHGCPGCDDPDC